MGLRRASIAKGDAAAQFYLGTMLVAGQGGPRSVAHGVALVTNAANSMCDKAVAYLREMEVAALRANGIGLRV